MDGTVYRLIFIPDYANEVSVAIFEYRANKEWDSNDIMSLFCKLMENLSEKDQSIKSGDWQNDDFDIFDFAPYLSERTVIRKGLRDTGIFDEKIHIFSCSQSLDADVSIKHYSDQKKR
jgi:hypothetical protein